MKVALVEMDSHWHNAKANLKKAEFFVHKAHRMHCEVLVFPEMFSSGFSMDAQKIAQKEDGFFINRLKELAKEYELSILAGIVIDNKGDFENRAIYITEKGELTNSYTKNYGFSYSGEDKIYKTGSEQTIINHGTFQSSVFICYDLRFPELFRKVSQSVSLIFVIANWPESRIKQWDMLLKARAIENQCFIVAVNRTGIDGNSLSYNGHSAIINPIGEGLEPLKKDEEMLYFQFDERETTTIREQFPFLKDMK